MVLVPPYPKDRNKLLRSSVPDRCLRLSSGKEAVGKRSTKPFRAINIQKLRQFSRHSDATRHAASPLRPGKKAFTVPSNADR
jgi:hypothetical protein